MKLNQLLIHFTKLLFVYDIWGFFVEKQSNQSDLSFFKHKQNLFKCLKYCIFSKINQTLIINSQNVTKINKKLATTQPKYTKIINISAKINQYQI